MGTIIFATRLVGNTRKQQTLLSDSAQVGKVAVMHLNDGLPPANKTKEEELSVFC